MANKNVKDLNIFEPVDPAPESIPLTPAEIKAQKKWEIDYELYIKDLQAWRDTKLWAYQLVQCTVIQWLRRN